MSMVPFSFAASLAISFMSIPLTITDTKYTKSEAGEDSQSIMATRTIQATVDPSGGRRLEQMFGGSVSDGDIGIYTTEMLYIDDIYASNESRGEQSYCNYQGYSYRVTEARDWTAQAGMKIYLGKRHVKQDLI